MSWENVLGGAVVCGLLFCIQLAVRNGVLGALRQHRKEIAAEQREPSRKPRRAVGVIPAVMPGGQPMEER